MFYIAPRAGNNYLSLKAHALPAIHYVSMFQNLEVWLGPEPNLIMGTRL